MEEQKQTTVQWLFPKIFTVILAIFIVGFGVQTYFLVDALMPQDQMLMKCLTVFAFDGCALIYSVAKQYYPFKSEKSLHAVQVMFRIALAGSAICTVLWVILSADHFNWNLVPPFLIFVAYVLVTFATTINVLVFYYIWEQESSSPKRGKTAPTKAVVPVPASFAQTAPLPEPAPQAQQSQPAANAEGVCFYCEETKPAGRMTLRRDPAEGLVPICWDCVQRISAPVRVVKPGGGSASPLPQSSAHRQNGYQ